MIRWLGNHETLAGLLIIVLVLVGAMIWEEISPSEPSRPPQVERTPDKALQQACEGAPDDDAYMACVESFYGQD